jgi:hypothetical protein
MGDFTVPIGVQKKPGGQFIAMIEEPADDEEGVVLDVKPVKIDVPEERAQRIGNTPPPFPPALFTVGGEAAFLKSRCHVFNTQMICLCLPYEDNENVQPFQWNSFQSPYAMGSNRVTARPSGLFFTTISPQ